MQLTPRQLDLFSRSTRAPTVRQYQAAPVPVPGTGEAEPLQSNESPMPSRQETLKRARALAQEIATHLGADIKVLLTVHDNRSTMISFRRQPPVLKIRAHHMFLDAPPPVIRAIADYAGKGNTAAGGMLDAYIAERQSAINALPRKPSPLEPRGQCFDLQELFEAVNRDYFEGKVEARIGWGRHTGKRRRKSIRLGVYDHKAREIRLHPALDRPDVPRFFVEFIVFHEMLHQLFPSDRHTGRHVHHPRAFRDRERAFPKFKLAMDWERQHLQELLRR